MSDQKTFKVFGDYVCAAIWTVQAESEEKAWKIVKSNTVSPDEIFSKINSEAYNSPEDIKELDEDGKENELER
jgi:hypothetical protein